FILDSIHHLLLHALGFGHTNNRDDRDNFIYVNSENIPDDFSTTSIPRFFDTYNVDIPMYELYSRVSPFKSIMYMDGMAWGKHQALTVFSPIADEVNPISWQTQLEKEDTERIILLYGAVPAKFANPCSFYENSRPPDTNIKNYNRLSPEERESARDVKKCADLVESMTTIRKTANAASHFGATVSYACKKDNFVMLGDQTRQ
ncbi:hatching enzyme-like protein, partial [Leptotrombidium deliense]